MKLSVAQDNVIATMIRTMAYMKTKDVFVVLSTNSLVKIKNKRDFAQVRTLENGQFKLGLRRSDELFDPVELRTLKVLVSKSVLVKDTSLSKTKTTAYRWDYNNKNGYPMTESIREYLTKQGVRL